MRKFPLEHKNLMFMIMLMLMILMLLVGTKLKQARVSNPGLIHNSPIPPPTNRKSSNEIAHL